LLQFCGSAFIALVSNDAGENKNRTSDKMKKAITRYINSKMNLEDEVQFQTDMIAVGFTKAEAQIVMRDIHARLNR